MASLSGLLEDLHRFHGITMPNTFVFDSPLTDLYLFRLYGRATLMAHSVIAPLIHFGEPDDPIARFNINIGTSIRTRRPWIILPTATFEHDGDIPIDSLDQDLRTQTSKIWFIPYRSAIFRNTSPIYDPLADYTTLGFIFNIENLRP